MSLIVLAQGYEKIWTLETVDIWCQQYDEDRYCIVCPEGELASYSNELVAKFVLVSIFDEISEQVGNGKSNFIVSIPGIQLNKSASEFEDYFENDIKPYLNDI